MHSISLQQQIRRVDQACSSAISRLPHTRTMREAVQAAHVPIPPELRALRHTSSAYRQLQSALTARLHALLKVQLEQARHTEDLEERKRRLAHWHLHDWQYLRGPHAALFREAESARVRLLTAPARPLPE